MIDYTWAEVRQLEHSKISRVKNAVIQLKNSVGVITTTYRVNGMPVLASVGEKFQCKYHRVKKVLRRL